MCMPACSKIHKCYCWWTGFKYEANPHLSYPDGWQATSNCLMVMAGYNFHNQHGTAAGQMYPRDAAPQCRLSHCS